MIYYGSDRPETQPAPTQPAPVEAAEPTPSLASDTPVELGAPSNEAGWGRDTRGVFLVEED